MIKLTGFYTRDFKQGIDTVRPTHCPYKKDLCKKASYGIDNHNILYQCPRFHSVSQDALGEYDDANDTEWRSTICCQDVNSIEFIKETQE